MGQEDAFHFSIGDKMSLMRRAVLPQLSFRCSRWPPQKQIAVELDRQQQKMVASMMKVPRIPGEEAADYVRRRGRLANKICKTHGTLSSHWFSRCVKWDEHLSRARNMHTWAARLREYHGKQWLIERRAQFAPSSASRSSPSSSSAGRTGTRAIHGKVHMRWHDGVDYARSMMS